MERKATPHERLLGGQNVGVVAVLKRPSPSPTSLPRKQEELLAPSTVSDAINKLVLRHPVLLRSVACSASGQHTFFLDSTPKFNPSNHVTVLDFDHPEIDDLIPLPTAPTAQWQRRLQRELRNTELAAGSALPPWRVVMFAGKNVIVSMFIYNHTLCDGCGGLNAHADFLSFLHNGKEAAELEAEGPLPVTTDLTTAMGASWLTRSLGSAGRSKSPLSNQ